MGGKASYWRVLYICAVVAAVVLLGIFVFWHAPRPPATTTGNAVSPLSMPSSVSTTTAPARELPPGYRQYDSPTYHFSLFYPNSLTVQEFNEGNGAATVTFQDENTVQGFQIYIVPYAGTQVSQDRFKTDEPSGVRRGLKNVTIDGATGASFYGSDPLLGNTAEIWFIHGGYLYEVTGLESEAPWLSQIMGTWQFF